MRARRIPEYGIEIIEGLPGSGKSLMCVRRVIEAAEIHRRPVYTNLPLKWPVVRAYLANRGGPRVADLIRPLSREFFTEFVKRAARYGKCVEEWRAVAKARGEPIASPEIERRWLAEAGENIIEGEAANWIPAGAVLCLDEVHLWFSMQEQSREIPELYRYLTMHRHLLHWVWAVTQDRAAVSISFRRICTKFWHVRDMRNDKLAWGLKFGHLGVHAIGYSAFTGDQVNGKSMDDATPLANYVMLPWLPWHSRFFRFYHGFSHAGNVGALVRQLERSRISAGLAADGSDVPDERVMRHRSNERRRKERMFRRVGRMLRWMAVRSIVLGVVGFVGLAVGRMGASQDKAIAAVGESTVAVSEGVTPEVALKWPKWEGAGRDYVRIGGQRLQVGGAVGEATIDYISRSPRALLMRMRGDVWVWKWGEPEPRRVGPSDTVRSVVEAQRAARIRSAGKHVAGEPGGHSVGAPAGDVQRE